MSQELYVLVRRSHLPTVVAWQSALDQSGFAVRLDSGINPLEHSGFLPCSYNGSATGFEFSLASRSDLIESYPELKVKTNQFDTVATFVWGGELSESASAFCAAAVLTDVSDGLMFDPQEGDSFNGPDAIVLAREVVESL